MPDIKARISQQNEIVASKVEVNTAGINLGDLTDVTITSPSDGSFIKYQNSSNDVNHIQMKKPTYLLLKLFIK